MPELRFDPLSGTWVIVAPERALRPDTLRREERPSPGSPDACPFCTGHEHMTPPEVARTGTGTPDAPGWQVRVVPNLYPLVGTGATTAPDHGHDPPLQDRPRHDPLRQARPARGTHEVVVLSPDHARTLARLGDAQATEVFEVLRDRVVALLGAGHRYVQVLVNHGREAGASIEHPHAQLVGIDMAPPAVLGEAERMAGAGGCTLCAAVERDGDGDLAVVRGDVAGWCPWWSGVPFEVLLAPRAHEPRFERSAWLGAAALALRDTLARLERALGDPAYNVVVHTAPEPSTPDYHWHVHLWPRLTRPAGFEYGTGILVNVVVPEAAAESLA